MDVMNMLTMSPRQLLAYGKEMVENIWSDETANMGMRVIDITVVVLIIALVLIPVGLVTLAGANTTGLDTNTKTIITSIGVVVAASVIILILTGALGKAHRGGRM